ncbi:hypothetical protein FOA52_007113 [Chlamydomonas sp. UWO 241]|nr:hypothetical protein FOA52_007113 [Chlamydomonas sp. UWO 241]
MAVHASPTGVSAASRTLEELQFDNSFVRELPGDPEKSNNLRQVFNSFHSPVAPTPANGEPALMAASPDVARLLGLDPAETVRPEFALVMAGAAPLPGGVPYAQCYGGHQFGNWAGQLGDGRAISIGEVLGPSGDRWELQLKGAGRTPYSRRADGRAVMRSSVREYVASEAMFALGVPTTRALSLVSTGDQVLRDLYYDGNAAMEPGAVVCRVSPSFVRFGTFELPASRGGEQKKLVQTLLDYVIKHHYPHHVGKPGAAAAMLKEVAERTALTVSMWQCLGFVHGVLNTDNMSILGVTIDYGPYGWMDKFDPFYTPNMTDFQNRRYAYRAQPEAANWNVMMLANALYAADIITEEEAQEAMDAFSTTTEHEYSTRFSAKMGLNTYDKPLIASLMKLMYEDDADFTNTFRSLSRVTVDGSGMPDALVAAFATELSDERKVAWNEWLASYRAALRAEGRPDAVRAAAQDAANPKFIPRQHLLYNATEGCEKGDPSELASLMKVLSRPFDEQPKADSKYSELPPAEMAKKRGVCVLSCSS